MRKIVGAGLSSGVLLAWVAVLGIAGIGRAPRSGAPEDRITVATWNIRWFPSGQPDPQSEDVERLTVAAAARAVRKTEPQILCVQEIRDRAAADALAQASGLEGFRVAVCSDFALPDGTPGRQQIAILTNLPVLDVAAERWHLAGTVDPPRGYVYALLRAPFGPVAVLSVHLKSNFVAEGLDEDAHRLLNRLKREAAADQLRAEAVRRTEAAGMHPVRILIAGDFNNSITDPRWEGESSLRKFLDEGYASAFEGLPAHRLQTLSATARYPAVAFDYIFHRGFTTQAPARIHPKKWVSDHRMVSVRLTPAHDG